MKNKSFTIIIGIIFYFFLFISFTVAQNTPPAIQWQKSLGGTEEEWAYSIKQTNDGGYIVVGSSESNDGDVTGHHGLTGHGRADFWVVKIDSLGNIQWEKSLGGNYADEAKPIEQTNDGGYIVAGFCSGNGGGDISGNHGSEDYWIVKLDSAGNIQWQKCYGGTEEDIAYSIKQTNDGGYIVVGSAKSNDGDVSYNHDNTCYNPDCWIVKLDSTGNIQWQKSYGGTVKDIAYSIEQTNDGGYIVAGISQSNDGDVTGNHGGYDCWIVKLDSTGNIQWQKSYGGSIDEGAYIQQSYDGGYIFAGTTTSNDGDVSGGYGNFWQDYWIGKLDSIGNLQWQKCLGGIASDMASSIQQTYDGGYIVAGTSSSNNGDVTGNHGSMDYWVVKLGPAPLNINEQKITSDILIYPNPSYNIFTVQVTPTTRYIQISNFLGQIIEERPVTNETELQFKIKDNGVYFVKIITDKKIITKKLIINK